MANESSNFFSGLEDLTIEMWAHEALRGDGDAAKKLLKNTIRKINAGEALLPITNKWLANCLTQIDNGKQNGQSAFGLTKPKGGQSKYSVEMQELIARSVHTYDGGKKYKGIRRDGSLSPASELAEHLGVSENKVLEFYNKHIEALLERDRIEQEIRTEAESEK